MRTKINGTVTWDHFIGSGALQYPWYGVESHDAPETDAWSLTFRDAEDPAEGEENRVYTLDHGRIMSAVCQLARAYVARMEHNATVGDHDASTETTRQCCLFLADPDCADFDAITADEVMQVAAFGSIIYG